MKPIGRVFCLGLAALAACGLGIVMASNTGFFVEYTLLGPLDSASGKNWLSLPYQSEMDTAGELFAKLGGSAVVASVARHDPVTDTLEVYTGGAGTDFAINPGESLIVTMNSTLSYELVGSHDPNHIVTLLGPQDSATGTTQYAHPFHAEAGTAGELKSAIVESCGTDCVLSIAKLVRSNDTLITYTGVGPNDFPLVPGEGYRIMVDQTVQFLPKVLQ